MSELRKRGRMSCVKEQCKHYYHMIHTVDGPLELCRYPSTCYIRINDTPRIHGGMCLLLDEVNGIIEDQRRK
jgi:hypothetical protein